MGLLDTGESWLAEVHAERESVTVTYTPKSGTPASLAVCVGNHQANARKVGNTPAVLEYTERDYLIRRLDWTTAGYSADPAQGDRITETINGVSCTFELSKSANEPPWRWSDASRTTYRVHTRRKVA